MCWTVSDWISTRMSFVFVVSFFMHNWCCLYSQRVVYKNILFSHTSESEVMGFFPCLFLFLFDFVFLEPRTVKHFRKYFSPLDSAKGCHLVATWANSKPGLTIKMYLFRKPWKSHHYQGQMIRNFFLSSYVLIRVYLVLFILF